MTVTLGNGLDEIGEEAFRECLSLRHIKIPNAIKKIKDYAFSWCMGLTTAILSDGLEGGVHFSMLIATTHHNTPYYQGN